MNHPILYGVYAASFPFLDLAQDKIRPVIVVAHPVSEHGIIAVVPVSSKTEKQSVDCVVASWRTAGLARPSVARVHRISTLLESKLGAYLGALTEDDTTRLKASIKKFLDL